MATQEQKPLTGPDASRLRDLQEESERTRQLAARYRC